MISEKTPLERIVMLAAGSHHILALNVDGRVFAWGNNDVGQLGIGQKYLSSSAPEMVDVENNIYH
jgi:alpha-tubulin suppressor-like RCC1 family protein